MLCATAGGSSRGDGQGCTAVHSVQPILQLQHKPSGLNLPNGDVHNLVMQVCLRMRQLAACDDLLLLREPLLQGLSMDDLPEHNVHLAGPHPD